MDGRVWSTETREATTKAATGDRPCSSECPEPISSGWNVLPPPAQLLTDEGDPLEGLDKDELALLIGGWLTGTVANHEKLPADDKVTYFHAQEAPAISVMDYVKRIATYSRCSKGVLVAAVIYMDRLLKAHPRIRVTSRTVHRLLMTAATVACKFVEDYHLTNECYSQIGGISLKELHRLEVYFLNMIQFKLFVPEPEYKAAAAAFRQYGLSEETSQLDSSQATSGKRRLEPQSPGGCPQTPPRPVRGAANDSAAQSLSTRTPAKLARPAGNWPAREAPRSHSNQSEQLAISSECAAGA